MVPAARLPIVLVNTAVCVLFSGAWCHSAPTSAALGRTERARSPELDLGLRAADLLMDGDLESSIEVSREIERLNSNSPLGYLLEADALWWSIYYRTADLIEPDVFDVVSSHTTPYDARFEEAVNAALKTSQARIAAHQDVARSTLYEGLAYALRARLAALRGKDLPTARAGKRMRALLLKALDLDSSLTDAYLGVGIYNYFVATLPTIVKVLSVLIALPGGSRETGIEQLRTAAEKGELARGEAKFYLAKDFSRPNEKQFASSLELFQQLANEYPRNPFWTVMIGSLHCRMGQASEGEAAYREVLKRTVGGKSEVSQALRRAASEALERRHPGEKPRSEN